MNEATKAVFSIEVGKTVRQVLDLLTRKRDYALLVTNLELADAQVLNLRQGDYEWVEILGADDDAGRTQRERRYLLIGSALDSRDDMLLPVMQESSQVSSDAKGCGVEFPPIGALYDFCEGKPLRVRIAARSEEEANEIWLRGMLRLGADPGKWYASDDSSSVKVLLQRIAEADGAGEADMSGADLASGPVDIADFEVYDRLSGKLERMARNYSYGDDIFVEYSMRSDGGASRYCATEFYSNHNWSADPANLLVVRFSAEVAPGKRDERDAWFSHPTKATVRTAGGERFLVDSLVMANDVATKFSSGRGDEKRPDETVSADRVMDNLVDFDMWVEMHRKEIELL